MVTQSCTTRHHLESAGRIARPSSARGYDDASPACARSPMCLSRRPGRRATWGSARTPAGTIGLDGHMAGLWSLLPYSGGGRVRETLDLFHYLMFHFYRLVLGQHSVVVPRVWLASSYFVLVCHTLPTALSSLLVLLHGHHPLPSCICRLSCSFFASLPLLYLFGTQLGMCQNLRYRERRCSLPRHVFRT